MSQDEIVGELQDIFYSFDQRTAFQSKRELLELINKLTGENIAWDDAKGCDALPPGEYGFRPKG